MSRCASCRGIVGNDATGADPACADQVDRDVFIGSAWADDGVDGPRPPDFHRKHPPHSDRSGGDGPAAAGAAGSGAVGAQQWRPWLGCAAVLQRRGLREGDGGVAAGSVDPHRYRHGGSSGGANGQAHPRQRGAHGVGVGS